MGSMYRSELMSLCQLFLHSDTAYSITAKLGELGVVQIIDLNSEVSFLQRRFVGELKRCSIMKQKLKFIETEIVEDGIEISEINEIVPAPLPSEMNALEAEIEKSEKELLENSRSMKSLLNGYRKLFERMHCISKVQELLTDGQRQQARQSLLEVNQGGPIDSIGTIRRKFTNVVTGKRDSLIERKSSILNREQFDICFIAGIVERRDSAALERLLWRMCGLNVFVRIVAFDCNDDPFFKDKLPKDVFIVFFYGSMLRLRVKKICKCFRAEVYDCPDSVSKRVVQVTSLFGRIAEMKSVIEQTGEHRHELLQVAARKVRQWNIKLKKMRLIFEAMNLFNMNITQKCMIAECWIPTSDVPNIRNMLDAVTMEKTGSLVPSFLCEIETNEVPPTYFRVNKFTEAFQTIINSYGTPTYREINPAPWTIITFPFLFAMMFSDAGHGSIVFLTAVVFILIENKVRIDNEIIGIFFGGRYVILLMGFFSIYTGFIYNDYYSRSMNLFGSSWHIPYNSSLHNIMPYEENEKYEVILQPEYAYNTNKGPYIFGLDPIWNLAQNQLTFTNSMKMKMSVILGTLQMTFGVFLSLLNFLYFRSTVDIFFTFVPQFIFLFSIFIYLCAQILIKWIVFSSTPSKVFGYFYPGSHCAPSLLIGLISMFMMKKRKKGFWNHALADELEQCHLQQWYPTQSTVEKSLLALAVLCILLMLIVKPIILKLKFKKESIDDRLKKFEVVDLVVQQGIHTIEFVLGCISHTASYLRLWALSLAHTQLTEVLWSMVLRNAFQINGLQGGLALHFMSWAFALLTFSVMVVMEGLSAFLHALRLHWVEFQSKFYGGHGYSFVPFKLSE